MEQTIDPKKAARDAAYQDVKMYIANDWNLKEETPEFFLLTRSSATFLKHLVLFLFFGWWTFGLANIIYYFAAKQKKKILK